MKKIQNSNLHLQKLIFEKKQMYGITTGFGALQNVSISENEVEILQRNLILSHCCGVGENFSIEIVRAIMLLRAHLLSLGFSGVRIEVVKTLIDMLNKGVYPIIPSQGSVGSSGDLAPLSHMASVMIGEGKAIFQNKIYSGKIAMQKARIPILTLKAKEGLALNNGTSAMTGVSVMCVFYAENLLKNSSIVSAMSLEVMKGKLAPFRNDVQEIRKHNGQNIIATSIRKILNGSDFIERIDKDTENIRQNSYSLRCIPQVHGAIYDTLQYVKNVVEIEINSVTDNPILFPNENDVVSAGNFHGEPIALVMDFLSIAICELGNISERRIAKMMDKNHNHGLPQFLSLQSGIESGLMISQYTAASLASENKSLSHPSSSDTIPTSANQEDHNSMGTIAARKCLNIIMNAEFIVSIEYLASLQASYFRRKENPKFKFGDGTSLAFNFLKNKIKFVKKDEILSDKINSIKNYLHNSQIKNIVENKVGKIF